MAGVWPNIEIDDMLAPAIDNNRHSSAIDKVHAPALQDKALDGKIDDGRSEIQFTVQPRFDRMAIRRCDIERRICFSHRK